ncbi:hypothetical protein Bbelb_037350 [Branchiostoma belcheri]|nr:hypothetical protein Bbelb_037350 [Branchiostoma belcheri]
MATNGNTSLSSSNKLVFLVVGVFLGYSLSVLQNFGPTVNIWRPPADYHAPPCPCLEDSLRNKWREFGPPSSVFWNCRLVSGLQICHRREMVQMSQETAGPRKILLDCGANVASTVQVPADTPGAAGVVYSNCSSSPDGPARLALTVQVGMNRKAAHKLVETIRAHPSNMPVTLFVYGDFVQDFPDLITKWADRYTIGIRESGPFPADHWVLQNPDVMRMSLVSAVQRMKEVGLRPAYYYPDGLSQRVQDTAKNRGLRIIQPTTKFPPNLGTLLKEDNYYRYRDVERTPKALRILYERISTGGILSLDTDHPDSYMISAFLMDYLYENSGFQLVSLNDCLRK